MDKRRDEGSSLSLHSWDDMGVLLQGEGRVLVAEAFATYLCRDASLECDRVVRVSEVVESGSSLFATIRSKAWL